MALVTSFLKFTDEWHWDETKLDVNVKPIYQVDEIGKKLYIFHHKVIKVGEMSRHEMLCWLDFQRNFHYLFVKAKKGGYMVASYCPFCNQHKKSTVINQCGHQFSVCDTCLDEPKTNHQIYTNVKFATYDINSVEHILSKDKIVIFYRSVKDLEDFICILNEPWFQVTRSPMCQYCCNGVKYHGSKCKNCYDFYYHRLYNQLLCKYNFIKKLFMSDIAVLIINNLLYVLGWSISYRIITPKKEIIEMKVGKVEKIEEVEVEKVEEIYEDLITEDNVDEYLEDIPYQYDDLCADWSDE